MGEYDQAPRIENKHAAQLGQIAARPSRQAPVKQAPSVRRDRASGQQPAWGSPRESERRVRMTTRVVQQAVSEPLTCRELRRLGWRRLGHRQQGCPELVQLLLPFAQLREVLQARHSAQPAHEQDDNRTAAPLAEAYRSPARVLELDLWRV